MAINCSSLYVMVIGLSSCPISTQNGGHGSDVTAVLPQWLSWLPVTHDAEEAVYVYSFVCELVERYVTPKGAFRYVLEPLSPCVVSVYNGCAVDGAGYIIYFHVGTQKTKPSELAHSH